jgi:hypothetical protein
MAHPRAIASHAARTVLFASVLPMAVFYAALSIVGLNAAIVLTLCWYYAGLVVRRLRKRPILGATMLGAVLMTVRAGVGLWSGSAFLYFLQPVAGTVATATSFAVTALAGRPLLEHLAHDFVPVPAALSEQLHGNRFFGYASALWAAMYVANAAGTVWLLTNSSLGAFLLLKTLLSPLLTGATVAVTVLLLHRLLRREGVRLRWPGRGEPATAALRPATGLSGIG